MLSNQWRRHHFMITIEQKRKQEYVLHNAQHTGMD